MRTRICFFSQPRSVFENKLKEKNLVPSGGCYAAVYVTGRVAIKVYEKDQAYDHYLTFVLANQDNPYVPKVFKMVIGPDFKAVVMEMLNVMEQADYLALRNNRYNKEVLDQDDKFREVISFIDKSVDYNNQNRFIHDISKQNVMKRDGGEFVITDPLCERL